MLQVKTFLSETASGLDEKVNEFLIELQKPVGLSYHDTSKIPRWHIQYGGRQNNGLVYDDGYSLGFVYTCMVVYWDKTIKITGEKGN